jgi:hypothetical protein
MEVAYPGMVRDTFFLFTDFPTPQPKGTLPISWSGGLMIPETTVIV